MLSVAPNIVFAPNMTQNAERKHRTQNTNTAHFRTRFGLHCDTFICRVSVRKLSGPSVHKILIKNLIKN